MDIRNIIAGDIIMYFKFVDAEVECVSFQYNDTENIFEMKDKENKVICEYYPLLNLDAEYTERF